MGIGIISNPKRIVSEIAVDVASIQAPVGINNGPNAVVVFHHVEPLLQAGNQLLVGHAVDYFKVESGSEIARFERDALDEILSLFVGVTGGMIKMVSSARDARFARTFPVLGKLFVGKGRAFSYGQCLE